MIDIGSLLGGVVGGGTVGGAIGWYVRARLERRWAREDRRTTRAEAHLEKQLDLLRELNGEVHKKWVWLTTHSDAANRSKAEPVANEIATWLYKHATYFPETQRMAMDALANMTFFFATDLRQDVMRIRDPLAWMWKHLQGYQREIETTLGLKH